MIVQLASQLQRILGKDRSLQLELDPSPLALSADVRMIDQVFINLATNARDAMPVGGTFRIQKRVTFSGLRRLQP